MTKSKNRPGREPRKSRSITGPLMLDARGNLIPRDDSPVELWLCVHRESDSGKAWLVSTNARLDAAVWVPKTLVEFDPNAPCGGLMVWHRTHMRRHLIYFCMMPTFLAMEKGLIEKANAKVAERVA